VFFDLIHLAHDLIGVCSAAIMQVPALIARRVDLNAGDSNQTETVQGRDRRSPLVLVWLEGRKADEMAGRRFRAQLCVAAFAGMVMIGRAACAQDSQQVAEQKIPTSCVQLPDSSAQSTPG
jgi:hypothetical protein